MPWTLPALGEGLTELTFRHLQLHPDLVRALEKRGIVRVGDLDGCTPALDDFLAPIVPNVLRRFELVSRHWSGGTINWPAFWNEEEIRLYWMAMTFGANEFPEHVRNARLTSLETDFGALLNVPKASGVETLGEIIWSFQSGSYPWRGFGALKVKRLGERLVEIAEGVRNIAPDFRAAEDDTSAEVAVAPSLPADVLAWDIDALGLGAGADKLRRQGRRSVESVLGDPYELWRLPGVGRSTVTQLLARLRMLADAIVEGALDLNRLAAIQGVSLIPEWPVIDDGELASHVAAVIRSVSMADVSAAAPMIFEHRISRSGSDAATLDDIARMLPERITRERVRQIEKRILRQAAKLLFSPYPTMGMVIIQPALKKRFRDLASALEQQNEIAPVELGLLISRVWSCSLGDAMRVLPMVMAVIEGTARNSVELRRLGDSPDGFFQPLSGAARSWSAQNTGGERGLCQKLEDLAIGSLEDLRRAWVAGRDFGRHEGYVRGVLEAACEAPAGEEVFAERLGNATGKAVVPAVPDEWPGYIGALSKDVAAVISGGTFWADSSLIFVERTSRLPNERPTMDALGARIGRLGVTVKRTETETLERLASVLLRGRGGYAQCVIRPDWLRMWRDMSVIFRRFPGDPRMVRRSIEQTYEVEEGSMTMAFPAIWAVLSGLPARVTHGKSRIETGATENLAPVRLSGFRSIH